MSPFFDLTISRKEARHGSEQTIPRHIDSAVSLTRTVRAEGN